MYVSAVYSFFSAVGAYVFIFYIYDVLKSPIILSFYHLKNRFGLGEPSLLLKYGNWAAITGSTDGIGKAYARELARRGFNIILISRNQSKLEQVAKQIESDFYVKTKLIVADFGQQAACAHVEQELNKTPVRILINNVSQAKSMPDPLENHTSEEIWQIINTNIGAVTQLSRYFIHRLKNAKQTGLIVNISSGTNYTPTAKQFQFEKIALYSAGKTFVSELTLALQAEAQPYGIEVQLLKPFFVVTKINAYSPDIMRGGVFVPDPITYARSAVDKLGKVNDTTGYFWHALQSASNKLFHMRLRLYFSNKLMDILILRTNGDSKWKLKTLGLLLYLICFIYLMVLYVAL